MELSKFFEDNVTVIFDRIQDRITNKLPLSLPSSPVRHAATPLTPVKEVRVKACSPHKPVGFQLKRNQSKKKDDIKSDFRQRSWTTDSETSWTSRDSSNSSTPDVSPTQSPMSKEYHHNFPSPSASPAPYRKRSATMSSLGSASSSGLYLTRRRDVNHNRTNSPVKTVFLLTTTSPQHSESLPSSTGSSPIEDTTLLSFSRRPSSSWRKAIFNRVCTPQHSLESADEGPQIHGKLHNTAEIRALWKKAILESLLLIRMEKENHHMRAQEEGGATLSRKLEYQELTPCLKEITCVWEKMLTLHDGDEDDVGRALLEEDAKTVPKTRLLECVKKGVPRTLRGQIWLFLMQQQQMCNSVPNCTCESASYEDLLKQLTSHQHAILIDLGRTFPSHPYFSRSLGPGQLELFNLLKAYSLLDSEVGYCQGLSFIVGLLLMHMEEISAFHVLKYLMFDLGLRKQFRPNMMALQIKLYQLTRLLHDHYKDVYDHFEAHEISPTLYAAPWFLTMFASQFPLGFVARVFDMIFIQGIDALFKVALMLIGSHRALILQCDNFEGIVDFLKITLPEMVQVQMERIINQAFDLDIDKELQAYEVEYHVLSEEATFSSPQHHQRHHSPQHQQRHHHDKMATEKHSPLLERRKSSIDLDMFYCLENQNRALKNQNIELLEKLQHAQSERRSFELNVLTQQVQMDKLKSHIRALELERAALLMSVARLRKLVPRESLHNLNMSLPATPFSSCAVLPAALSPSSLVPPTTPSSSTAVLPNTFSSSPGVLPAKPSLPAVSLQIFDNRNSQPHADVTMDLKLNRKIKNDFSEANTTSLTGSTTKSSFKKETSLFVDDVSAVVSSHKRGIKPSSRTQSLDSTDDSSPLAATCGRPDHVINDSSPLSSTSSTSSSTFTTSLLSSSPNDDYLRSNLPAQKASPPFGTVQSSKTLASLPSDTSSSSGAAHTGPSRNTSDKASSSLAGGTGNSVEKRKIHSVVMQHLPPARNIQQMPDSES